MATSTFLPLLLERADVHLTRFSAVTLEAAALGIPTIATDRYAADLYESRLPPGTFWIKQSAREIAEQIESLIIARTRKSHVEWSDLSRLVPFIEKVISDCGRGWLVKRPGLERIQL